MRRPAGAWALVVAACALSACEPPGAGLDPFPGDGVSAFGPSAPVSVCIGSVRAIPGGAASLCIADSTSKLACEADSDCPSPEVCQCGRCLVQACDPSTVCPSGEACRSGRCAKTCVADAECGAGQICTGGGCTKACDADSDCHRGEVCGFQGTCESTACGPMVACGAGQSCEPVAKDGDVREPSVIRVGEQDVLFFELRGEQGSSIYRAVAKDPLHFKADPETPVLVPGGSAKDVRAPSALVDSDGSVSLFVAVGAGESIGLATSKDGGRTFQWTNENALLPAAPWEKGVIGSPGAVIRSGVRFVFYEGGNGAGIGLAKLTDGALVRVATEPVMRPVDLEDAVFWRSVKSIGAPFALADGPAVRVYVTANGIEAGGATTENGPVAPQPNDSIGLFATFDLTTFDRYPTGPVFATEGGLFGSLGEREPSVHLTSDGATMYFIATNPSGAVSSGLAAASTVR